jgi:hypothetical protein
MDSRARPSGASIPGRRGRLVASLLVPNAHHGPGRGKVDVEHPLEPKFAVVVPALITPVHDRNRPYRPPPKWVSERSKANSGVAHFVIEPALPAPFGRVGQLEVLRRLPEACQCDLLTPGGGHELCAYAGVHRARAAHRTSEPQNDRRSVELHIVDRLREGLVGVDCKDEGARQIGE